MARTNYFWWDDDDDDSFVLDQYAKLDFNSASSLKQQSAVSRVTPIGQILMTPVFPLSPYTTCLAEKKQIHVYTTLANHYITTAVYCNDNVSL